MILREFGSQKKTEPCSILEFIESQCASRYQLSPPPGAFEYLLLNGRAIVIFDGLDELLDTSYRQEISGDVESFCSLYPAVPVLVTSREVGYAQAPLDQRHFRMLTIAPFDEEQVRDYAKKWFSIDDDLTPKQCAHKVDAFLAESSVALDIRSNPLMLGLMCNLYRAEGYIPRNLPEIYEKCSMMLFERWDKARGILVPLPFEVHVKPAMRYLAYWIYSQESLQGGVTQSRLIDETTSYLVKRVFEDAETARRAASEFIDFCTGRAWVFTDTGTTPAGERIYQFTHRTFLEYFAAVYLFSVHPTPDKLVFLLLPRIAKQEWDVVAQLAFQIQSRAVEDAADKLLTALLEHALQSSERERWNVLLFAARTLQSIVPKPSVRRAVAAACVREVIAPAEKWRASDGALAMVTALHSVGNENRSTVAETVQEALIETLRSESASLQARASAYDVAFQLQILDTQESLEQDQYWAEVSQRIFRSCLTCLEGIASKELFVGVVAFQRGDIGLEQLVAWHGPKALFVAPHSRIFSVWWLPIAVQLLRKFHRELSPPSLQASEKIQSGLVESGRILLGTPLPWRTIKKRKQPSRHPELAQLPQFGPPDNFFEPH